MSGLIDSFRQAHADLPPQPDALKRSRQAAIDALTHAGLPGSRSESWKYTSLRALGRHPFAVAPAPAADDALRDLVKDIPAPRAVFVNGAFVAELSLLDDLPDGIALSSLGAAAASGDATAIASLSQAVGDSSAVFALANSALALDGLMLRVADGVTLDAPLNWVLVSDGRAANASAPGPAGGVAWHGRHQLQLGAGARLTLLQHELSLGEGMALGTSVTQVSVGDKAELHHLRLQDLASSTSYFLRNDVELHANARYQRLDLELGLGLSRNELNVQLAAGGAQLQADGVLLGSGSSHCDTRLGIVHAAGNTRCELTWRGLGRDRSRVAFHGGITIEAGADGSEAMLSNKNLLLSDQAEVDTQPVLVIHADEVKAAHGATVGRLDPTALFYLRSRGLPADQARRLLTAAFCRELLGQVAQEDLREALIARLDTALARESLG